MIAAAVGLLGIVVFLVIHKSPTQAAPVPIQTANSSAPSIDINVATNTPAKLFLDDAPLGESPYHNAFPRDGLAHRVRAEATGDFYAPRTEIIVFDKPTASVTINLAKGVVPGETVGFRTLTRRRVRRSPPTAARRRTARGARPVRGGRGSREHRQEAPAHHRHVVRPLSFLIAEADHGDILTRRFFIAQRVGGQSCASGSLCRFRFLSSR